MVPAPRLPELQKRLEDAQGGIVGVSVQGQGLDLMIPEGPSHLRIFWDAKEGMAQVKRKVINSRLRRLVPGVKAEIGVKLPEVKPPSLGIVAESEGNCGSGTGTGLHISIGASARGLQRRRSRTWDPSAAALRALTGLVAPPSGDTGDPGGTSLFLGLGGLPRPTWDTSTECKRPPSSQDTSGTDVPGWLHSVTAGLRRLVPGVKAEIGVKLPEVKPPSLGIVAESEGNCGSGTGTGLHISIGASARGLQRRRSRTWDPSAAALRALTGLVAPPSGDTGDPGGTSLFLGLGGLPRPTWDTSTECKRPPSSQDTSGTDVPGWLHSVTAAPTQTPTTTAAALEHFTVNFTITNLPYTSDLENPDSAKFNATQRVMNTLLDKLLKESSIGPDFHGCMTTAFSHRDQTRVDAVCTYSQEPSGAPLDRVGLYHQVSNKTRGITQLGPYSLHKDSLYVNGDRPPTQPPTTTAAALERFTVNFTITNLPYTSDLENPDSAKFRATQRVMNTLLDKLLKESSIGPDFHGCMTTAFSHRDQTRVDAVCTYSQEPSGAPLDRVGLYHQVSNKTSGITQLGPYSLHKDSLYVNGDRPPTQPPTTTAAALERFTVNFTITNLPYTSDLENPDSAKFRATQRVMNTLLDKLLKESSIGPDFHGCMTTAFRYGS
ncbi:hypothetical protein HGM15179_014249, partial [Zosterops borbonicus]